MTRNVYVCRRFPQVFSRKDTLKGVAVTFPKKNTKEKRRNE